MLKRPYIPLGCTQQGRLVPTKLTERHLQLRIAEKHEHRTLPDLLLATGAMEGPFRRTRPALSLWQRIQRDLRELLAVYRLYRHHHSRSYAAKRAWHIVIQGSPF